MDVYNPQLEFFCFQGNIIQDVENIPCILLNRRTNLRINITDEALNRLNILHIKHIKIIFHGQGCGGPVFNMVEGQADADDVVFKIKDLIFSFNQEIINDHETIDIDYSNNPSDGFFVGADSCGGCIRCNGCWLNTVKTNF